MSRALGQQRSQDFKRITISKHGRDKEIRTPVFDKRLKGEQLRRTIGRLAWEQSGENRDKAVKIMNDWLLADHQLFLRMSDVDFFCRETIDDLIRGTRPAIKRGAETHPTAARRASIQSASRRNLMEYPLRPGLLLGDATKDRLLDVSEEDESKAKTMASNVRWFRLIAKNLPDNKTKVRVALEESDIERFLKSAQKEAA